MDVAKLGRWMRSWIQPDGAIHGFHNHTVWGDNPLRWGDLTSGHSTWASPFLAGLARGLAKCHDEQAAELLRQLVRFQTRSFQENGSYRHVGFQVGETLKGGLIHNAITNVSLLQTVLAAPDVLGDELVEAVRQAFQRNVESHQRLNERTFCTNQDYARIWGKLLYHQAFGDDQFVAGALEDMDILLAQAHRAGIPHEGCSGTLRNPYAQDLLEPAEYYGLMILPLILAYEMHGRQDCLDAAGELCRHVAESVWEDVNGCLRMHRSWAIVGGSWTRMSHPMLIAGMGDSLEGMRAYLAHCPDEHLLEVADRCDQTMSHYQHPAGFVVPATGWQCEIDVVPSSAWSAHDWRYRMKYTEVDDAFWERFWSDYDKTVVVMGPQCLWVEKGPHWGIVDYKWQSVYRELGRKDCNHFGRDMFWIGGERSLPEKFLFTWPQFMKLDNGIVLHEEYEGDIDAVNMSPLPLLDEHGKVSLEANGR